MRAWAAETGKEKGLATAEAFKVMVLIEEPIFRCSLFCAQVTEFIARWRQVEQCTRQDGIISAMTGGSHVHCIEYF